MAIAAGFQHRIPTLYRNSEPTESDSQITLNTHLGQEFNYILEGELEISIAGKVNVLYPGDSIMFDARRPHGLRAMGGKRVRLIAIIS